MGIVNVKVFINSDANEPCFLGYAPEHLHAYFIKQEEGEENRTNRSLKFSSNSANVMLYASIEQG